MLKRAALTAALVVAAAAVGIWSYHHGRRDAAQAAATPRTVTTVVQQTVTVEAAPPPAVSATAERTRFRLALVRGIARGRALGGRVAAAVWVDDWPEPLVDGDDAGRPMRMWSLAKPVEALAVLEVAERQGVRTTPAFEVAMERSLRRSENCSARRMVLELEQLTGGPEGARNAFADVLAESGARAMPGTQRDGAAEQSAHCTAFLEQHGDGLRAPNGVAVLLGTSEWTIRDAIAFAHALGSGRFGGAGERVLATLAQPKLLSEEPGAVFTAATNWGAGEALATFGPAYKSGWGGTQQHDFLAGQYAVVEANGHRVALAVVFHPSEEPDADDPGSTRAPAALAGFYEEVARALPHVGDP